MKYLVAFLCLIAFSGNAEATHGANEAEHRELIRELAKNPKLGRAYVEQMFGNRLGDNPRLKIYNNLLTPKRIPPHERKRRARASWRAYKQNILGNISQERGVAYLVRHWGALSCTSWKTGVDPYAVVAILGAETQYGTFLGDYDTISALYTLWFSHSRHTFAKNQLGAFLVIVRENRLDPFGIRGSWAGAFGIAQFIPRSYQAYARDGDGDGIIDLFNDQDAIASVAHYLQVHNWARDKRRAVWRYNRDTRYVDVVMELREKLKARLSWPASPKTASLGGQEKPQQQCS